MPLIKLACRAAPLRLLLGTAAARRVTAGADNKARCAVRGCCGCEQKSHRLVAAPHSEASYRAGRRRRHKQQAYPGANQAMVL